MYTSKSLSNRWIIPTGKYRATLKDVREVTSSSSAKDGVRLIFEIPQSGNLEEDKMAGVNFDHKFARVFGAHLANWIGQQEMAELFPGGEVTLENLKALIGREAVLHIDSMDKGEKVPFSAIKKILSPEAANTQQRKVLFRLPGVGFPARAGNGRSGCVI